MPSFKFTFTALLFFDGLLKYYSVFNENFKIHFHCNNYINYLVY